MKHLSGAELAGYIKERQAKQVRMLRQAHGIFPRLCIFMTPGAGTVIETYVRLKKRYGDDILVDVQVVQCAQSELRSRIDAANEDPAIHGIIIQLPLDDPSETDALCDAIAPEKDVDGLGKNAGFASATAEAIDWLLLGYGVELAKHTITLVGRGKLVGSPLAALWRGRGLDVTVLDRQSQDMDQTLRDSSLIVSAAGVPRLLHDGNVARGAIVVDAGTVSEDGKVVGDADPALQERSDLTITPIKGGVGPLTVVVLFDHVILGCLSRIPTAESDS